MHEYSTILPKVPPPNNVTLDVIISTNEFWRGDKHSDHISLTLYLKGLPAFGLVAYTWVFMLSRDY